MMAAFEDPPHTRTQSDHTEPGSTSSPVRLRVIDGPDLGREFVLAGGTAVVGTRADCDLVVTDPLVSRRHVSVELFGSRVRVRDAGSKNGTRFLGARIDSVEVAVGSTFAIGGTRVAILPLEVGAGSLSERTGLCGLIGGSVPMRRLYASLERVAATAAPVLIQGETGTGKESVAQAIHALSERASGPLRIFDCGSVQPDLLASALFGHVRGAFTGAVSGRAGVLQEANGGTLFLDEVAELPLDLQPTLLRALDTGAFVPVGASEPSKSDFRIVAATHHDLELRVREGAFRKDLYYRLAAIAVRVPALRERIEDVPLLAAHFATALGGPEFVLPPSTLAVLTAHHWPGNVRELRNAVERAVALGPEALLPAGGEGGREDFKTARERSLRRFERGYLEALMARCGGSTLEAARQAGVARSYIYRLLEEHGMRPGRK
jgi:DNA-binding NtrC family response regulator